MESNMRAKLRSKYGWWYVIKNHFKIKKWYDNISKFAETFSVKNEWEQFLKSKNKGVNFTHVNIIMLNKAIEDERGVNFQKKIRNLIK